MDVSYLADFDLNERGSIRSINSSTGAITTDRYTGEVGTGEQFSYGEVQLDVTMNGKTGSATTTVVGDTLTYEYEDPVVTVVYDNPFVYEELISLGIANSTIYPRVAEYTLRRNMVIASTGEVVTTTVIDGDLDDPGDATFEFLLWDMNEEILTDSIDPWYIYLLYHDGGVDLNLHLSEKDLVKEYPIYIILKVTVNGKTGYGACGPLEIIEGMYVWADPIVSLSYGLPFTMDLIKENDYEFYPTDASYTQAYNLINPKTGAIISSEVTSGDINNRNGASFDMWMATVDEPNVGAGTDGWNVDANYGGELDCDDTVHIGNYGLYICLQVIASGKTGYAWDGPIEVVEDDNTTYTLSFANAFYLTGDGVYNTIPVEGGTFTPTITVLKNTFVNGALTDAVAVTPSNITYALAVISRYCTLDVTTGEITIMANDRSTSREFTINVTAYYSNLDCSTTITLTLPTGFNTDPFISGSLSYITSAGTNIIPAGGGTFEPTIELYLNTWSGSAWVLRSLALSDCDASFITDIGTITEDGVLTIGRLIGGSGSFTVTMGLDYDYNGTTLSFDTSVDLTISGGVTVEPV